MSTEPTAPKIQGPHLRAAIAELPKESKSAICRDNLEGKGLGAVASAINDRLVNDLPHILDVMVAAAGNQSEAYVDEVQVGLMIIRRDLAAELERIGHLTWAIWADDRDLPLKVEDR